MREITYYSSAKTNISSGDISNILKTAREFNSKNKITGCLLFHNHQFIQILEGERGTIDNLISKIRQDNRHSNMTILAESDKEERTFENWTMAFRELNDDDLKNMNETLFINNFLGFSALAAKPTRTIRSFWTRVQRILTNDYTT